MSLNYGYIFSQIDKAKKKKPKHYVPWNSPESKKLQEENAKKEEAKPKTGRNRYPGYISDKKMLRGLKDQKDAEKKKIQDKKERNEKDTYTGVKGDFPPASHETSGQRKPKVVDLKIPKHIKGLGGKKQHHTEKLGQKKITNLKPRDTKPRVPGNRRNQLRRQYQDQSQADKIFEKERDEETTTSFGQFRKLDEAFKLGETTRYKKYLADRQAKRAKREQDAKERKERGGPKKKKKPKSPLTSFTPRDNPEDPIDEFGAGDPNPDKEPPVYGEDYTSLEDLDQGKSLWKSWLEKRDDFDREERDNEGRDRENKIERKKPKEPTDEEDIENQPWFKAYDKLISDFVDDKEAKESGVKPPTKKHTFKPSDKAEEGIGGMNMGAQRGLGHEAGYKQDPGQSAQITEVKDEKEKSAYENHEQDESPENEPNKQQIPPSKPGTDTFKSLYKKALIIKYKNIYKPANI